MIERTLTRGMPRGRGWLALAAMLAMSLMPALARLGVDAGVVSVRLPTVLCLAWPSSARAADIPADTPAPAASDAACPFCAAGTQPGLASAIGGWQPLSASGDRTPDGDASTGPRAARRGPVRARGPPCAGPTLATVPTGRRVPNAPAA